MKSKISKKRKRNIYKIIVGTDGRLILKSNTSNFITKPMTNQEVLEYVRNNEINEKQRTKKSLSHRSP